MADESDVPVASEGSAGKWILLALAVIYVAGSLYFIFDLRGRLDKMSKDQAASSAQIADLGKRMQSAEADDETLATQLGMTKKEMVTRSAELMRNRRPPKLACRSSRSSRSARSVGKWRESGPMSAE